MDAELNTNVGFFGANLIGYPHVNQGNNYNNNVSIPNESEKSKYQALPTDDLSHIWATNHRDNIDDLDSVLRDADPAAFDRAYDVDYHGARNLDVISVASNDMWNFSKYLEVGKNPNDLQHRDVDNIDGMLNSLQRKDMRDGFQGTEDEKPDDSLEKTMTAEHCYPLWLILIAIVLAIFGCAYMTADIFRSDLEPINPVSN